VKAIIADNQRRAQLPIELAVVAELVIHVYKAMYRLEGDGPLVLIAYETV